MNKDKLIVSQVAFKGAIDLAVAGKIEVSDISEAYKAFANDIWDEYGTSDQAVAQAPAKVVSKPAEGLICPHCGSKVYDNRATKTKPTQPNFKCSNTDCGGGKEYMGKMGAWASWSDEPTADMHKGFEEPMPVVTPKSIPDSDLPF